MESGAGDMGNAWRWLAETLFGGERSLGDAYGEMDRLAASVPPGANGVSVSLGPQAMDVSSLGMRLGGIVFPVPMTLGGATRAQICRAALESFAYAIRANLEQAERESGVEATRIAFGGGLTRSATLRRILPSVLGRPVTTFAEHDVTAAGAAGARAHGEVEALSLMRRWRPSIRSCTRCGRMLKSGWGRCWSEANAIESITQSAAA